MSEHVYMAFLDILGYQEHLRRDIDKGAMEFKDTLIRAFRVFENLNVARYSYQAISDSMFISCRDRTEVRPFLELIRRVFVSFLQEGLMLRGGISYGPHFQSPAITYSPVLTKAYQLESKIAKFPRIIVDSNVVAMFPDLGDDHSLLLRSGKCWVLNVITGTAWIDLWEAARNLCEKSLDMVHDDESVRNKHRWLQNMLLELCPESELPQPPQYLPTFDILSEARAQDTDLVAKS
jgi:hypothetical protein